MRTDSSSFWSFSSLIDFRTSESQDACSGTAELPSSDDLCYTGSFLVEKFFVKLSKQTATSGSVDLQDACLRNEF